MSLLHRLVKRSSIVADSVFPPPAGITILIYHQVGGAGTSAVDIDPATFERHLAHLVEHHRVLTMDQAARELTGRRTEGWASAPSARPAPGAEPGESGRSPVVLTFDDGTRDFAETVVPALERHGLPATLYVATQFVDENERFPWGAPPTSWSALRDALETGLVTIGSHTHTHRLLDRLDGETVEADLDRSIELLGDHLDVAPTHFAYPKAILGSPAAEIAVRRRFCTAVLAASRVNRVERSDLHRLWRTPVQRSDDFDMFVRKASGGLRLEGELRATVVRTRNRRAER